MSANLISYLADLTDPTFVTREVDLNANELDTGPFEMDPDTIDLGAPTLDGVWLSEAGKDEDVLSAHRRGRVEAGFDLRIAPRSTSTFTTLQARLRALNAALDRSGVWVLQQPGQSSPMYVDYYPSPLIQQLMPGQRSMYFLWAALQQPNGMRVTIVRRPKMRGAARDAGTNLAHNALFAEDHDADGEPTYWTWDSLTGITFPGGGYDWTFGAHEALIATSSARFLYQTSDDDVVAAGSTYTFAIDVAASYSSLPQVRARIDWFDISDVLIGSSVYSTAVSILLDPRLQFSRPTISGAVAPTGAVHARYGIEFDDANANPVHAWIRNAQFESGVSASTFVPGFETVSNDSTDPFGKRIWLLNDANADALTQMRATPDVGGSAARMSYSRRSGERDSAMAMRILPGWNAADSTALMNGTTSVSDGGRSVAKTALADDIFRPVLRFEVLQTEESALKGTWRLKAALSGDLADAYSFEGRYGLGDVDDLPRTMWRRYFDLTGPPAARDYYEIDLGLFKVPPLSPGWFFELWARREVTDDSTGTGELYIDQFWPEPADDDVNAIATIPDAQAPGGAQTEFRIGSKLDTPPDGLADDPDTSDPFVTGSVYNDDLLLNDLLEACGLPLGMTDDLSAVLHTFVLDCLMFTNAEKQARVHGEFRVHDLTDDVQITRAKLKNDPGVPWSQKSYTVRFTPVPAHEYLVYVVQTVATSVGNIHVQKISHSFVTPVEGATQTIAIDADQRRAYVLEGDDFKADLDLVPPFPILQPKVQLYRVSFAAVPSVGSDDVLDGGPALRHDPARSALTGFGVIPRWYN